ncbi:MAG TPA: AEC family transporter [Candidatus Thermoplasmatota archaeon]|nr:AEC family transporter [Candidatus Thermoplasmatota archaeon]
MDLVAITFQSVLLLLGIGVFGFLIVQRKVVAENALGALSNLALDLALPCLVFVNIVSSFSPQEIPDWWVLPLWWVVFTGLAALLTGLFMFVSKKTTRREFAMSLFLHNGLFFPLAILTGMFGASSPYIVSLFLFMIFYPAFLFNIYPFFFGKNEKKINWRRIFNIVFISTILALVIRFADVQSYVPSIVLTILTMLGAMTVPLLMLVIGGSLSLDFQRKGKIYSGEIAKFVLIKNLLFPLIFLGVLLIIRPSYQIALLLILQSAVPPVTALPIFMKRVGGNESIVNQFLLASFIGSLVSIPLVISLFTMFFPGG